MLDQTKVLVISDVFPPREGDVAHSALRNALLVQPYVDTIEALTFSRELAPGTVTTDMEEGIPVYRLGISKTHRDSLETIGDFITLLQRKNQYHIFHIFKLIYAGYMGVFQAHCLGAKSLISLHRGELEDSLSDPDLFPMSQWALKRADALVGASQTLRHRSSIMRGQKENTFWVPASVDPRVYHKKKNLNLSLPPGRKVGIMGELKLKYGLKILLHAFQIAAQKLANTSLVLIGDLAPEEKKTYQEFLKTSGLRDRIQHISSIEEEQVPYYLSALDLFLLPSLRGDIPLTALKAMACECPVIASEIGGFQELIDNGRNGFFTPPGNPRSLANRIIRHLNSPLESIGKAARQTIIERHLPRQEREGILQIYQLILENL